MESNFGVGESPAGMPQGIPGGYAQAMPGLGNQQVLSNDEQRRLLAIAMNTGRTSSSFMPPTGFGLGFGAGLGTGLPPDFGASLDALLGTSSANQSQSQTPTADSSRTPSRAHESRTSQPPMRPGLSRNNTSTTVTTDKGKEKVKPGDRTAHNDIERKYRTNLKDKIAELRDAVPALHSIPDDPGAEEGESASNARAPKVSKVSLNNPKLSLDPLHSD